MIQIEKNGFLKFCDEDSLASYIISDKEVLSFLKEPINSISSDFTVRDFIQFFDNYPSLYLLCPDFNEVSELLASSYEDYQEKIIERVVMSISVAVREDASAYLNVVGLSRMTQQAIISIPLHNVAFKHIVNADLKILPKMNIDISTGQSFSGNFNFSIHNFTFFDFFMSVSDNLVLTLRNEPLGDLLASVHRKIKEEYRQQHPDDPFPQVPEEQVKSNTQDIMSQIKNLINPPKKED